MRVLDGYPGEPGRWKVEETQATRTPKRVPVFVLRKCARECETTVGRLYCLVASQNIAATGIWLQLQWYTLPHLAALPKYGFISFKTLLNLGGILIKMF